VQRPQQEGVEVEHRQIDQAAEVEVVLQGPQSQAQEAGEEALEDRHALEEVVVVEEGHQVPQNQAPEGVEGEGWEMM
jgi:hypothetical protein